MWKYAGETVRDGLEFSLAQLIQWQPLAEKTVRFQTLQGDLIVLNRVKVTGLAFPRNKQIGNDDIEFSFIGQQVMPCVIYLNIDFGIVCDVVVVLRKHTNCVDDFGDQLDCDYAFDIGVWNCSASC